MSQDHRYLAVPDGSRPRWGRRLLQPVLYTLIRSLTRPHVEGLEHLPRQGPVILIINHIHAVDPFVTIGLLPRYGVPLSKIENYDLPVMGPLMRWYGVIPIKRGEADIWAVKAAEAVLSAGHLLLMAPEGTRSRDGALQQGKEGLAFLARQANPVITPLAISGTTALMTHWRRLRRTPLTLRYGPSFRLRWPPGRPGRQHLRLLTDAAMGRLAALLPPEMRGVYSQPDPAWEEWLAPADAAGALPTGV